MNTTTHDARRSSLAHTAADVADTLPARPDALCIAHLGRELRVLDVDIGFLRVLGRSAQEVRGYRFVDFVHPSMKDHLRRNLECLANGRKQPFRAEMIGLRTDSTVYSGELTCVAIRSESGQVSTITLLFRPYSSDDENRIEVEVSAHKTLSKLNAQVLEGIAAGMSTVRLASKFYLSRQGVEYHVATMLRRFNAPNRPALVSRAYVHGILISDEWPPRVAPEYIL